MLERKDSAVAAVAARRHWGKDDARLLIEAWRQSGQTITAFARTHDLHPERLARWHRLLRAEPQPATRFHPVRVRGAERHSVNPVDKIELVLSKGRTIRLPHRFDAEDLRRLLAVMEATA